MTNPIDSPARASIGTPSTTTQSFGLALGEIRTMKPEELTWLGVAIEKQSISPSSTQWSKGLWWWNAPPLHQVTLHLNLDFSTVQPQSWTYGTDWASRSRTGTHWMIDNQCTTASEGAYSGLISRARLSRMGQHDIFIPGRYAYSIQNSNDL
jgi:hypothetical protein